MESLFLHRFAPFTLALLLGCSSDVAEQTSGVTDADEAAGTVIVLAKGSNLRGANGLMFGPDGRLYQTSVVTPAVAVLDPKADH